MPLSDTECTDARRFCGYPAVGKDGTLRGGAQFYILYGQFEFRLANLSNAEALIVRRYLGTLTVLEVAIPKSAEHLDTDQASVWTRNRTETADRISLFDDWRRRLCDFLGVPPGPGLIDRGVSWLV